MTPPHPPSNPGHRSRLSLHPGGEDPSLSVSHPFPSYVCPKPRGPADGRRIAAGVLPSSKVVVFPQENHFTKSLPTTVPSGSPPFRGDASRGITPTSVSVDSKDGPGCDSPAPPFPPPSSLLAPPSAAPPLQAAPQRAAMGSRGSPRRRPGGVKLDACQWPRRSTPLAPPRVCAAAKKAHPRKPSEGWTAGLNLRSSPPDVWTRSNPVRRAGL